MCFLCAITGPAYLEKGSVLRWFHICASELILQLGFLLSGSALVDFGCIQLCRLPDLVSPWIFCSTYYPFCVWRKCHDIGQANLQLLASLSLLEVCQFNKIVWGIWLGFLCSLLGWVFLSLSLSSINSFRFCVYIGVCSSDFPGFSGVGTQKALFCCSGLFVLRSSYR